jgi:hypothetical protein
MNRDADFAGLPANTAISNVSIAFIEKHRDERIAFQGLDGPVPKIKRHRGACSHFSICF